MGGGWDMCNRHTAVTTYIASEYDIILPYERHISVVNELRQMGEPMEKQMKTATYSELTLRRWLSL